jgi:hypothetical protein
MRYRLRTLLILLAVGPIVAAGAWRLFVWFTHGVQGAEGFDQLSLADQVIVSGFLVCLLVLASMLRRPGRSAADSRST